MSNSESPEVQRVFDRLGGVLEASALAATNKECYAATSREFCSSFDFEHPIADRIRIDRGDAMPQWPNGARFAVCLTHDVDNVSWQDGRMHWRRLKQQLKYLSRLDWERRALVAARCSMLRFVQSCRHGNRADPLHCYEKWLQIEQEVGAKSTFFFLPEHYRIPHYSDGGYTYQDRIVFDGCSCTVREMMREIHQAGWEVGLHGSWYSFNSAHIMRAEKEQVERAIASSVVSSRQHHLHFDIRRTPRVLQDAGIENDSSLGFNDAAGFRLGSSWPWRLHDLERNEATNVLEIPLVVQDKCLVKFLGERNEEKSVQHGCEIANRVEQVGGVLTLLWHPNLIRDELSMNVYRSLLQHLRDHGAWFATLAEVGRWCRSESRNGISGFAAA